LAFEKRGVFKYIDLRGFFPLNVAAFFLVNRNGRHSTEEIREFLEIMGCPADVVHKPKQVHSSEIIGNCGERECDGVHTGRIGEAITIAVADCVPILISADGGKTLVALHSGWKGTIGRIAEKACRMFDPSSFDRVWIGLSIRKCCYEVPANRIEAFTKEFPGSAGIDEEKRRLDLPVINAEMIESMGVPKEKITMDGTCSCCSPDGFASYRRDGEKAGRMVLVAVRIRGSAEELKT